MADSTPATDPRERFITKTALLDRRGILMPRRYLSNLMRLIELPAWAQELIPVSQETRRASRHADLVDWKATDRLLDQSLDPNRSGDRTGKPSKKNRSSAGADNNIRIVIA